MSAPPQPQSPILLIVADDDEMLGMLRRALLLHGYMTELVRGAPEALELVAQRGMQGFDLLLADLSVADPKLIQLIQIIRSARPPLPVVLLTGLADLPELEQAMDHGAVVLRKPFTPAQLDRLLRAALAARRTGEALGFRNRKDFADE